MATEDEVRDEIVELLTDVYPVGRVWWRQGDEWQRHAAVAQLLGHKPYRVGDYVLACDWRSHGGVSVCCQRCNNDFTTEPDEYPEAAGECENDWAFWNNDRPLPTVTL